MKVTPIPRRPSSLLPQHRAPPTVRMAQLKSYPRSIVVAPCAPGTRAGVACLDNASGPASPSKFRAPTPDVPHQVPRTGVVIGRSTICTAAGIPCTGVGDGRVPSHRHPAVHRNSLPSTPAAGPSGSRRHGPSPPITSSGMERSRGNAEGGDRLGPGGRTCLLCALAPGPASRPRSSDRGRPPCPSSGRRRPPAAPTRRPSCGSDQVHPRRRARVALGVPHLDDQRVGQRPARSPGQRGGNVTGVTT